MHLSKSIKQKILALIILLTFFLLTSCSNSSEAEIVLNQYFKNSNTCNKKDIYDIYSSKTKKLINFDEWEKFCKTDLFSPIRDFSETKVIRVYEENSSAVAKIEMKQIDTDKIIKEIVEKGVDKDTNYEDQVKVMINLINEKSKNNQLEFTTNIYKLKLINEEGKWVIDGSIELWTQLDDTNYKK